MPRPLTRPSRLRDLVLLALAASVGLAALIAYTTLRIRQQGARDELRPAGAIVVLGAAQFDGRPSPVYAARLDHAVSLFLHGMAPVLIVTGGKAEGDRTTEAETGRIWATAHGVPDSAILAETRGRNTLESLEAVAAMLRTRHIRDAIFVSDPTHMLRVLRIAQDLGIVAWGSPTPTSMVEADNAKRIEATIHELGGLALYFFAHAAPPGELGGDVP